MELEAYVLRTPRRLRTDAITAPSNPMSHTLSSYQSYFYSVPASPDNNGLPFSEQSTSTLSASSATNSDTESETCEFKFATSSAGDQLVHIDRHLLPLKLPPRLQSPSSTPLRVAGGGSVAKRGLLEGLGFKNNKQDFDPFAAAVERIRTEDESRHGNPSYQRAQSCEPLWRSFGEKNEHKMITGEAAPCGCSTPPHERVIGKQKGAKSVPLAFVGAKKKKGMLEDDESSSRDHGRVELKKDGILPIGNDFDHARLEARKEKGRSTSSARYKQSPLACFRFN